ncbi:carboxypeptidase regulatory-like domain-containing protein [Geoalkalibacter sp.]|uniref:carboxypeptidase regulatory-like domain-containing protein n=1 Tax=Geoalkalibacter sp. TaxID=3041440 RepID=UPI00272EAA0D|nr:carboxypeptidase regulatory-like domain-containing protein [Geoalkalibacter sp.]
MTQRFPTALLLIFALLLPSAPAWAHKVNIFAYVEGKTVYTESYFSAGKPVREGRVQVFDSNREPLLDGRTDEEGRFSFPVPKIDDLTIVIEVGMGHKNSFQLKKSALGDD